MDKCVSKIWSVLLVVAMLAGFFLLPDGLEAEAANDEGYSLISVIKNYSGCGAAQGMTVDDTYIYNVKIASSTSDNAIITRTHRITGETIYLTNGSDGTEFFTNLYHANDLDIVTVNGVKNLLVATTQKGNTSLIRFTLNGTTLTQAAGYTAMSDGSQTTVSSAQVMRVNGTKLEILFKRNKNLFYGTVDASKSSGEFTITKAFTLDMANVTINGKVHDMTDWLHQGFDYIDHRIFVPFTCETDASISTVVVYDVQGASGTIQNDPNLSFYIDSEEYPTKFEIESVGICPSDGKLYFNTNQAKSSSDGNHDAINVINDYVYDPSWGATEPGVYRWEAKSGTFQSVTTGGAAYDGLAMSQGSISGTGFTDGRFSLHEGVVLKHDQPWVVEWKSSGNWTDGSMLMSSHNKSKYEGNRYIFRRKDSSLIALGECVDGLYYNYGLELSDFGIDGTAEHVYRLTNKLAADGSNMVYLSVDGQKLGPMNQYYMGGISQGTTSDWLSGKDFTFSYFGTDSHPIDDCSLSYVQIWGTGLRDYCTHSYVVTETYETTCQTYAHTRYTCTNCEDSYIVYPDELFSDWQTEKPNVDDDLVEAATQYRFSDYETITSYETSMDGYEQAGSKWVKKSTGTVNYVSSWPSGFSTSNSLYSKYNNKSQKVTASTTATQKVEINSDKVVGYLYYHWCYSGYPYTSAIKTGNYTRFHAYYSTTAPSSANATDPSDNSYRFDSSTACSDSKWYFVVSVYAQKYTTYDCQYTYGRWGEFSEWDLTPVQANASRKVETRTVYRYFNAELKDHHYTVDMPQAPDCTNEGTATYLCSECGDTYTEILAATGHSYEIVVTDPTCTEAGDTTYTCTTCGDSYVTDEVAALGHSYKIAVEDATCTVDGSVTTSCGRCGYAVVTVIPAEGHSYDTETVDATCTVDGFITNTCSVCGVQQVQVVPATGHSYQATQIAPTCTTDGYTNYVCDCGDVYLNNWIEPLGHRFVDGICDVCGAEDPDYVEPVVIPTLALKAPTLEFKDMITVNAMFTAENLDDVVEMGMITYTTKVDTWSVETADYVIPGSIYDASTGRYIATSQGIHAKYLGDTVYLACYAKLTDGSYVYTKLASYSPVQYAESKLKGTDTALKQLVVAMLNYGAAAQTYFGHNTGNLANATLSAEQKALPAAYNSGMVSAVASAPADKQGIFANNQGFSKRTPSISFEGAFSINYFFTPKYTPDSGITMYYWTAEDYNANSVLTTANATGKIQLEGSGTGQYQGDIEGIAAKALSEAVYVACAYKSGDTVWTSGVLGYSIGAYCSSQATKGGTIADLAMATAVYGYQAKQYFG